MPMVYDRVIGYNEATGRFVEVIMNVSANGLTPDDFIDESVPQYSGQLFQRWYNRREAARIDSECQLVMEAVNELQALPAVTAQREALSALQRIRQLPAGAQIMMIPFSRQLEGIITTPTSNLAGSSLDARFTN